MYEDNHISNVAGQITVLRKGRYMQIQFSIKNPAKQLRRILAVLVTLALVITSLTAGSVSAYYTVGASGQSLEVISGFAVNKNYPAPYGSLCRSGQLLRTFAGVTIHETSNWSYGANARMHALYLQGQGQSSEVSWHYSVDSTSAYQSIPETEKAWHAGDTGNGVGNASTIAIEICDNSDGNFDQALANAEWLAADILFRHNVQLVSGALFQHHDFSAYGKNCPITIRDTGRWNEFCTKVQGYLNQMVASSTSKSWAGVACESYVQNIGWQGTVRNGAVSGTVGQSIRLEALTLKLENADGGIEYRAQVQEFGWQNWVSNGAISGTTGQARRLEAIEIRLTGAAADQYDIYYRVSVQTYGWLDWAKNGQSAGTIGYAYRVEAFEAVLVPKGGTAPGATTRHVVDYSDPAVSYESSVQNIGWQGAVNNGASSGTVGQAQRLEAIKIQLANIDGGIEYRTHVQNTGWMDWMSNGTVSGTTGQSKRLEAIQIRLTGAAEANYDIYYRVYVENTGWMDWAENGQSAGTAGYSYRLEAIQIVLVAKGGAAPGATSNHYLEKSATGVGYLCSVQDIGWQSAVSNGELSGTTGKSKRLEAVKILLANINGCVEYSTHVQDIGWTDWVSNGAASGTIGQSKRLEAIQIRLTGAAADQYDIYYRVHAQNVGWLDWAQNGQSSGTAGFSYRLEAIQILLVNKGDAAPGATAQPFLQR